ncbi:hypothetical protein D3C71_1630510 [compost metagenome]
MRSTPRLRTRISILSVARAKVSSHSSCSSTMRAREGYQWLLGPIAGWIVCSKSRSWPHFRAGVIRSIRKSGSPGSSSIWQLQMIRFRGATLWESSATVHLIIARDRPASATGYVRRYLRITVGTYTVSGVLIGSSDRRRSSSVSLKQSSGQKPTLLREVTVQQRGSVLCLLRSLQLIEWTLLK